MENVIDAHIHFCSHYSGGLTNEWVSKNATEGFRRDWTEEDYREAVAKSKFTIKAAIFVECFNAPSAEEARWALRMAEDPASLVAGVVASLPAQRGAAAVRAALDELRVGGALPKALKGGRTVFMVADDNSPGACLKPEFFEGLGVLQEAGLVWEFCCNPSMAPNLPECCSRMPGMTFVVDHLAHNGNDGGELDRWGPAMDALGRLPNVYAKMGAVEEWDVPNPEAYMDRAIAAFGFDRIVYESNWFVSQALGFDYDRTAVMLLEACRRAGASDEDLQKVFGKNAIKVYSLDV